VLASYIPADALLGLVFNQVIKSFRSFAGIIPLAKRRSRLVDLGFEVFPRGQQTPEALGAQVKADAEKWWPIIKELGIKAE